MPPAEALQAELFGSLHLDPLLQKQCWGLRQRHVARGRGVGHLSQDLPL